MNEPTRAWTSVSGATYLSAGSPPRLGGQAEVFEARDLRDRRVAIKWALHPGDSSLEREMKLLAQLGDSPVLPLLDHGDADGRPFLVLPWCDENLASWCARGPDTRARLGALAALADALADLHGRPTPLLHGDVKPTNALLAPDGAWRWADLGGARALPNDHTRTVTVFTSRGFSPPEARAPGAVSLSVAWDVWALASTALFVLTGESASDREDGLCGARRSALGRVVRGSGLQRVLHDALRSEPGARWPRADLLARALRRAEPSGPTRRWPWLPGVALACTAMHAQPPRALPYPTLVLHDELGPPLRVGRFEVDQGLWRAVSGDPGNAGRRTWDGETLGPSCADWRGHNLTGDDLPVTCVDWLDAVRFANQLSAAHGLRPAYALISEDPAQPEVHLDPRANGWRLPTVAEWHRLRGPSPALDARLCERENVADRTARSIFQAGEGEAPCEDGFAGPAPTRRALSVEAPDRPHDVYGNVAEWLWDEVPGGRAHGGGSWSAWPGLGRLDATGPMRPDMRGTTLGFRLVRGLP